METGKDRAVSKAFQNECSLSNCAGLLGVPSPRRQPSVSLFGCALQPVCLTLPLLRLQKSPVLCIGEEQPKNWFTELQVLKGHFDIVRFLVQIDDFR